METTKLKPCPFCGAEPTTFVDFDIPPSPEELITGKICLTAYVKCPECGIYRARKFDGRTIFNDYINVFNTVIFMWNMRAKEE